VSGSVGADQEMQTTAAEIEAARVSNALDMNNCTAAATISAGVVAYSEKASS
jgi:hypothetical protein